MKLNLLPTIINKKRPTELKKIHVYESRCQLDTIRLKGSFSNEEIDSIFDNITYGYYKDKAYYYNIHMPNIGFTMHVHPIDATWTSNFNCAITLQTNFFIAEYIPHSIVTILKSLDWRVRCIDVAFDYKESYENSFVYKHHGLVKHRILSDDNNHTSFNLGSPTVEQRNHRQISYNRNEKEISKGISDGSRHKFATRFEAKLRFEMKDDAKNLPLNSILHERNDRITKQLSKYIFIVDLENDMKIDGRTKRIFQGLRETYDNIIRYDTNRKKELKAIAFEYRQPIEVIFMESIDRLFDFLTYKEHPGTIPKSIVTEQYNHLYEDQQQLLRL